MKAALKTSRGDFEIKEVPIPQITNPDYVLARVRAAGVCGSDLHYWKVPTERLHGKITGHELAGEVVEVGDAVRDLKKGDRVAIESLVGCGTCYWCRVGQYHVCPELSRIRSKTLSQAFSEYVVGPARNFYKIPMHVSFEEAAILDVYGTSIHACNRTNIRADETVVIIGAGPIGLSLLELANVSGAKTIVIGKYDYQLELAKKLGAYATINTSKKEGGIREILDLTEGRGADTVFECVGGSSAVSTMPQAVSYTRRKGKVAIVGGLGPNLRALELDWQKILWQEIDILPVSSFAYWGNDPEFKIVLDLLIDKKIDARSLITHRFPLVKINEAFGVAANKKDTKAIKVVLVS